MAIGKGFKQTDVGVIPNDWQVRSIQEISNPVRGGSPRPAGDPRFFEGTFIPWLTVAALTNIPSSQLKVSKTDSCLTEEGSLRSRILYPETLILANSGATLGVAKILDIKCCANDGIAALLDFNPAISTTYLVHYINTRTQYLRDVVATGNGQPNLNTELIGNFKVPFPPTLAEQEAIAGALSDADAWIESLDQLIAKKRQIKQGAMQELLTGKRRLPGFSGRWQEATLGEICTKIQDGTHFSPKLGGSDYLYLTSKNIRFGVLDLSTAERISANEHAKIYSRCDVRKGDLLLTKDGANTGNAAINTLEEPFSLLSSVALVRFDERVFCTRFFLYQLLSKDGQQQIKELMSGNAITRLTLQKIRTIECYYPQIQEQTAIATVLSDMDTEIGSLESKLGKAREIKQGMMQELLTGKIRLV